jgi:sigma-B regulation protein RsbU (phosphoserine phosphatase)
MSELPPLLHVLIVDDDEDDYLITRDLLSDMTGARFLTDWVTGRDSALERMALGTVDSGTPYDFCLLDYRLGRFNGLEVLRDAIQQGFSAPIILLTGQDEASVDREAMQVGAADYLIKGHINAILLERSIRYARQKKLAEEELRESREKFRSLVEVTSDWIWEVNAEGRYTFVSPQIADSLGYQPDEVLGKEPFDLMPSGETGRIHPISDDIVEVRRPFQDLENEMQAKDGSRVYMEISGTPLFDSAGKWIGYRGVNRDITARKEAEEALRRQTEFVSAVLDTAGALVTVFDRDGKMVRFNRACEETTGYKHAEILDRPFWEILLLPEEEIRTRAFFSNLDIRLFPNQHENIWLTKEGEERRIAWANTALRGLNGKVEFIVSTGIDVTEQRRAEEELAQAREREVEVGASIQRTLLVGRPPTNLTGVGLGMVSVPSQKVGGDYLDFFTFGDNVVDVLVGDVMGKGVPAALLAAATKSHFQRVVRRLSIESLPLGRFPEPEEIVSAVHALMTPDLLALNSFVTLSYARFDLERRLLTFVDCGHPRPLHLPSGAVECQDLMGLNVPLGVLANEQYQQVTFSFSPGDMFLFYSDGLSESSPDQGEELFGQDRLAGVMVEHGADMPQEVAAAACEAARAFAGPQGADMDDLTCVAVRIQRETLPERLGGRALEISSDADHLETVRRFITTFCHGTDTPLVSEDEADLLALAVNEATANIMRHAYKGAEDRRIRLEAEAFGTHLRFRLFDTGEAFRAKGKVPPPSFDGSRDNGFGVYIIHECMDEVAYQRDELGRNCLTMIKRLQPDLVVD